MGTRLEMLFPGLDEDSADEVFLKIMEQLETDEKLLSIYREDSVFSRINSEAWPGPCSLEPATLKLIEELIEYIQRTLGFFNPFWGIVKNRLFKNTENGISDLVNNDIENLVRLDKAAGSISFNSPSVKIDSGGFGKGYALESIKKILLSFKILNAFISFGDSSVMTFGRHPAGDVWKVGIKDQADQEMNAWVFEMNEGSVSTSGNTPQNRSKASEGHLVDPTTGKPVKTKAVISVQGISALFCEVLSTALFVASDEKRKQIMNHFTDYKAVEMIYIEENNKTLTKQIN